MFTLSSVSARGIEFTAEVSPHPTDPRLIVWSATAHTSGVADDPGYSHECIIDLMITIGDAVDREIF